MLDLGLLMPHRTREYLGNDSNLARYLGSECLKHIPM